MARLLGFSVTGGPLTNRSVTLGEASRFWLRLGLVSFGGPAGQISLLHTELVERRRWLSERRFLHALNYCMLLPGPEATQLATYLGYLMHGVPGGLIAGGLFLAPSVLVLLSLSTVYAVWGQMPLLVSIFWALKPAVLAVVLVAAWRLGRRTLHHPLLVAIAAGAFVGLTVLRLPYPLLVGLAALTGWIGAGVLPQAAPPPPARLTAPDLPTPTGQPEPIHGDHTPTPAHARFSRGQAGRSPCWSGPWPWRSPWWRSPGSAAAGTASFPRWRASSPESPW